MWRRLLSLCRIGRKRQLNMDEDEGQQQDPTHAEDSQHNERPLVAMANEDEEPHDLASGTESGDDSNGDGSDSNVFPLGAISDESHLPSAREHSYLPGNSHPLLVPSAAGGGGPSSPRATQHNAASKNKRARLVDEDSANGNGEVEGGGFDYSTRAQQQLVNIPVLELPGVVLFPGMTLPIRLRERALIPYLARQIELCRTTPHLQPQVRIGIITYLPYNHRVNRRQSRADGRQRDQQQRRRRRRRRFYLRRRSQPSADDSPSSSSDEEDVRNVDESRHVDHSGSPQEPERAAASRNPLVSRIGTIATVAYTHELAALDNPTLGDSIESTRQIFRNHLDDNELVVTAIGTNRFRVVSYVQEESFADLNVFQVEEIIDRPLCLPRLGRPLISFPASEANEDAKGGDQASGLGGMSTAKSRMARHNQLLWNLSSVTPTPYCAYKAAWPWKLVDSIVGELEAHHGGDNLPSLRDVLALGNKSKTKDLDEDVSSLSLEPTKFSYTMSYNMPFSDDEKLELLQMDSTLERLRVIYDKVLEYAEKESFVFCKGCDVKLSSVTSVFTVGGAEGTTSNYGTFFGRISSDQFRCAF